MHRAKSLIDNKIVALKTIDKQRCEGQHEQMNAVANEVAIQASLDHPGCVKVLSSFQDDSSYYLVLELCEKGELYKYFPYE